MSLNRCALGWTYAVHEESSAKSFQLFLNNNPYIREQDETSRDLELPNTELYTARKMGRS